LRVFNKENDITYIGQGVGYTQGLGISYEVDFDTFRELISKVFKNKKLNTIIPKASEVDDSSLPDGMSFDPPTKSDKKEPKKEKESSNKEAIPTED
jgi:hypothetical protein